MSTTKRTYGSRPRQPPAPSLAPSAKRKLPLEDRTSSQNIPPAKRLKLSTKRDKCKDKHKDRKKPELTQLHFSVETSILRTCSSCGFSYTMGAPQDESLHRAHCVRVQRGMEWGKEEEREKTRADVLEIDRGVTLKDGTKGRIISFRADVGGRIKSKLTTLLETINLALSSPPLTPSSLQASKAYLFLVPTAATSGTSSREKIVGCVIAQRITTAMAIASPDDVTSGSSPAVVTVDSTTSLFAHPTPLPTPMGISRLFVAKTHRRVGIARQLLDAAAKTFVHGCPLDPRKGEVAFTQPTRSGAEVMKSWGGGGVRIYE